MKITQKQGVALYKRTAWKKELDAAKIDMGLSENFSQARLDHSLYIAVIDDNHKAVREMIEMGANPNMWIDTITGSVDGSLLHFAVQHASLKTVTTLLQKGACAIEKNALNITPRESSKDKRITAVLKSWEQRKMHVNDDDGVVHFDTWMQKAS